VYARSDRPTIDPSFLVEAREWLAAGLKARSGRLRESGSGGFRNTDSRHPAVARSPPRLREPDESSVLLQNAASVQARSMNGVRVTPEPFTSPLADRRGAHSSATSATSLGRSDHR